MAIPPTFRIRIRTALAATLLALLPLAAAQGQPTAIAWTARAGAAELPDQLAPGYHVLELTNDGDSGYTLMLFRLHEGTSLETFQTALAEIDRAFMGEGDPAAAINAALELGEPVGEVHAEGGESASVGAVLEEGSYLLDGSADSDGMPERSYQSLTVAGDPGAAAPEVDVAVQMVDFAFALPPGIGAGPQTWQVTNLGAQLHHLVLFRLQEGRTMDDFRGWMETEGEGEPVADEVGGVGVLGSGRSNYLEMDLAPGEYVAICFMPDHVPHDEGDATGQPHFTLGMMQTFAVAGE